MGIGIRSVRLENFSRASPQGMTQAQATHAVTVAVLDTGIDPAALQATTVLAGINLSGAGNAYDTTDEHGHGTKVAALIVHRAPQARLLPVKLLDSRGMLGNLGSIDTAFAWLRERSEVVGLQIICLPFANQSHLRSDARYRGSRLQQHIAALREAGVATVAAAGNWYPEHRRRHRQGMAWPAILQEVMSVGAVQRRDDGQLWLSRTSQRLHSSLQTGCATTLFVEPGDLGETSGACAQVAGVLAALRQTDSASSLEVLLTRLLAGRTTAYDDTGLEWPALALSG
jgi:subtilisin family serine protease